MKTLTEEEEAGHRKWARESRPDDHLSSGEFTMELWDSYHPVVQEEWKKRGIMPVEMKRDIVKRAIAALAKRNCTEKGIYADLTNLLGSFRDPE